MASMKKHKQWHKVQDSQEKQIEGEIITEETEIQDADDIQQTCIVTKSTAVIILECSESELASRNVI
jgi:hypothetical protein